MVDLDQIRAVIADGLESHLNVLVIEANESSLIPPYPFLAFNFTTAAIYPDYYPVVDMSGIDMGYIEQPEMLISMNSYADTRQGSIDNAMRAHDWFRVSGYESLNNAGLVAVDVGDIRNRDIQIGDEWERRNGFDVRIRVLSIVSTSKETIEQIETKGVFK
ncbi:hypothetical protein E0485_15175 [Paenibacillus albiflavus]|uniref:Phage neck terminator protein gp12-like domain-containing protein n=1 Tax=Paenibacillus albiflavus TaxID=2545760 RepID=A0A4R4E8P6_9BACL|nr:hypothetical protein [Paenibacillus albiflavus]TCZ76176.1 hypothetical protein E0485_15175 [Paenibacillus albiflavus]